MYIEDYLREDLFSVALDSEELRLYSKFGEYWQKGKGKLINSLGGVTEEEAALREELAREKASHGKGLLESIWGRGGWKNNKLRRAGLIGGAAAIGAGGYGLYRAGKKNNRKH